MPCLLSPHHVNAGSKTMVVSNIIYILFWSLFNLASAKDSREDCHLRLDLNRLMATRSSSYVYTCDCIRPNGRVISIGRAQVAIPSSPPDTAAQASASIRCILEAESRLLRICAKDPRRYDRRAAKRLAKCVRARPTASDRRLRGKFRFSTKKCKTSFLTFFGARTAAVWVCGCDNGRFNVISGRAAFVTDASPLGATQEAEVVRVCGNKMVPQMAEICRNNPEDFNILGLQLLQVCCKRGRVRLPNGKFGCAAVVPDDLSRLKINI